MSDPGGVAGDQLRAFVERIERLEEEKKVISDDIKDSMPKPRATALTSRSCGRWFPCARSSRMSVKRKRRFSTSTCMHLEWLVVLAAAKADKLR